MTQDEYAKLIRQLYWHVLITGAAIIVAMLVVLSASSWDQADRVPTGPAGDIDSGKQRNVRTELEALGKKAISLRDAGNNEEAKKIVAQILEKDRNYILPSEIAGLAAPPTDGQPDKPVKVASEIRVDCEAGVEIGAPKTNSIAGLLFISLLMAALGAVTNNYRRVSDLASVRVPPDSMPPPAVLKTQLYVSTFFAVIFALIFVSLFASRLLTGELFPTFVNIKTCYRSLSELLHSVVPVTNGDGLKQIVWCFLAGFAERLVPNILDDLVSKGKPPSTSAQPQGGSELQELSKKAVALKNDGSVEEAKKVVAEILAKDPAFKLPPELADLAAQPPATQNPPIEEDTGADLQQLVQKAANLRNDGSVEEARKVVAEILAKEPAFKLPPELADLAP